MTQEPELDLRHREYALENRAVAEHLRETGLDALASVYDATAILHDVAADNHHLRAAHSGPLPQALAVWRDAELVKARCEVANAVGVVLNDRNEYAKDSPEGIEAERDELLIRPELEAAQAARKAILTRHDH